MLNFATFLSRDISQTLVHSETEVGQVNLIPALLIKDYLIVVQDLESEVLHQPCVTHGNSILHQTDVDSSQSLVSSRSEDLLLEDDSILRRVVGIGVFNRLTTDDFLKFKSLIVSQHVDSESALSSVVRHSSLDDKGVPFLQDWQSNVLQTHIVESHGRVSALVSLFYDLDPHVIQEVLVSAVEVQIEHAVFTGHLEVVFGKKVVSALLEWQVVQSVLLGMVIKAVLHVFGLGDSCNCSEVRSSP